jgi:hypothetical protein
MLDAAVQVYYSILWRLKRSSIVGLRPTPPHSHYINHASHTALTQGTLLGLRGFYLKG